MTRVTRVGAPKSRGEKTRVSANGNFRNVEPLVFWRRPRADEGGRGRLSRDTRDNKRLVYDERASGK